MISQQVLGTLLVVSAAFTFALVAFIVEKDPLPTSIATEARFLVCWVVSVAFMLRYRTERGLSWFGPAHIRWGLILRGFLTCGYVTCWWAALTMAPLGDCIAVIYCAPIVTVGLSRAILGEKIISAFPLQALFAVVGMLFLVEPPFIKTFLKSMGEEEEADPGDYTFVILALFIGACMPITTRSTKAASWIEVEHVTSFLAVFVLNPISIGIQQAVKREPLEAIEIDAKGLGLVILAAMGSFVGVAMQTKGYQLAEPGKAGMYNYVEIPFGYILQRLGTDEPLTMHSMIGSTLVLTSCLVGAIAQFRIARAAAASQSLRENELQAPESKG